jgi:arylsulfatase A-like enzyme
MLARVEATLRADGIARDTYIVFSSDNGLHTGEYRLMPGKMTAFDTDIRVPLVVTGPGVPAGVRTGAISQNVDLAKTFAAIGGAGMRGDGHSLLGLLHGRRPAGWRNAALVEHHGPVLPRDPDFQRASGGNPDTYEAMRGDGFLYVEYRDGEREFYDLRRDPFELDNLARNLPAAELAGLHDELVRMRSCNGGRACWAAMHVAPVAAPHR